MTTSPRLGYTELVEGQAIPETDLNEMGRYWEQGAGFFIVKDKDLATPPGSPATGDAYIVAASPTGTWTGHAKSIAFYLGTAWAFVVPIEGTRAAVQDEDVDYRYSGSAWAIFAGSGGGTAASLDYDTDGTLAANSDAKLATQKATKTYVDAKVAGLSWKQAVRAASTANGTLATAFENGDTFDGVTLATGDRILLKNQSSGAENGIYTVNASGAPTRATDADAGAELVNATCYVSEGTANADTQWTCSTNATITVGSTSLTFAQLTSAGAFDVGAHTWTGKQTLSAGADITPESTPSTTAVGYLGVPQNTQNGTYTTVMTDAGKMIYHTSGSAHTWTIDSNANVAYPIGTVLTFVNENSGGNVTLAITSDTLRWGSSTGSRTLAANGTATAVKVASTTWRLTGDGIT
jgi:Protein of unknown function (DUF2793)